MITQIVVLCPKRGRVCVLLPPLIALIGSLGLKSISSTEFDFPGTIFAESRTGIDERVDDDIWKGSVEREKWCETKW